MNPITRSKVRVSALWVLLVLVMGSMAASGSNITYNVNRTAGIGTITGFIETDGTIGVLGVADFVDWSLLLNNGTSTYTLDGPLSGNNSSVYLQGIDTTATATQLLFNFSGTDNGYLLFQYGVGIHDGFYYYCDANFGGICLNGETISPSYYTSGGFAPRSGDVVIGTTVPEPGSLMLLNGGVLAAVAAIRRRFRT